MKHIVVVTGLALVAPLVGACAENANPPTSAQKSAYEAEKASQKAQKEAAEARQNTQVAEQKQAQANQNLRNAQAQESQADQRAQQASHGAGYAEERSGAAAQPQGVTEAQGGTAAPGEKTPVEKVVVVTVGLLFPRNGLDLNPAARPKLDEVAAALSAKPEAHSVMVEGFTDDTGDPNFNKALSAGRAQVVADYLESKGIPKDWITTRGLGQEQPVSAEKTVEGRAMNRRVEIMIQPAGQ